MNEQLMLDKLSQCFMACSLALILIRGLSGQPMRSVVYSYFIQSVSANLRWSTRIMQILPSCQIARRGLGVSYTNIAFFLPIGFNMPPIPTSHLENIFRVILILSFLCLDSQSQHKTHFSNSFCGGLGKRCCSPFHRCSFYVRKRHTYELLQRQGHV